jgi:hypothetical protein
MWFVDERDGFALYWSTEMQRLVLGATADGGNTWRIVRTWPNQ